MSLITVIIPTYNRGNAIRETICSVLSQNESDLELLVIDDGSTDNTSDVVKSLDDERVKYCFMDNGGTAAARNYGLSMASGQYIAFLDHDDLWPADFLEVMLSALKANPEYGVAYSLVTVRFDDGSDIKSYKAPDGRSGWLTKELFERGFVWTSAAVIRRSVLKDFRYDEALRTSYEDGDFFLRLSVRTPYFFVEGVEAIRTDHCDNLSRKTGVQPTRILVLERFYFELGGKDLIPTWVARKKLSHACRKVARSCLEEKKRTACVFLFEKAIKYWPFDVRLYPALLKAIMLDTTTDVEPEWKMLKSLAKSLNSPV